MFSTLHGAHILNLSSPLDGLSNAENRLLISFSIFEKSRFDFLFALREGVIPQCAAAVFLLAMRTATHSAFLISFLSLSDTLSWVAFNAYHAHCEVSHLATLIYTRKHSNLTNFLIILKMASSSSSRSLKYSTDYSTRSQGVVERMNDI